VYRLWNQTEGAAASGLCFLKFEDAEAFKGLIRWPYEATGFWPLADGRRVRLERLELKVELLDAAVWVDRDSAQVFAQRGGVLGASPLLPGDCFDPGQWAAFSAEALNQTLHRPLFDAAWEHLS
jgi:hypothetical protein